MHMMIGKMQETNETKKFKKMRYSFERSMQERRPTGCTGRSKN